MKNKIINPTLVKILACPVCKSDIDYVKDKALIVCSKCKKEFKIKEGIPVLLPN